MLENSAENASTFGLAMTVSLMLLGALMVARALRHDAQRLARLRESEERFRLLVSGVKDYAIFMLDPKAASSAGTKAQSASRDTVPWRRSDCTCPPSILPKSETAVVSRTKVSLLQPRGKFRGGGLARPQRWIPLLRKHGNHRTSRRGWTLRGFAKVTRDVTEKRSHEAAIEEAAPRWRRRRRWQPWGS